MLVRDIVRSVMITVACFPGCMLIVLQNAQSEDVQGSSNIYTKALYLGIHDAFHDPSESISGIISY